MVQRHRVGEAGALPTGPLLTTMVAGLILLLAACGSSDPATPALTPTSTSSPVSNAVSSPVSSTLPTTAATSLPPGSPSTGSDQPHSIVTKLAGTIERGTESGCLLLINPKGGLEANLVGLDAASAPFGSPVVVTGKFQTGMMTHCMQGPPFVVAKVELQRSR